MPFFKKSKKADLGSTASEVTLVDPSACQAAAKGTSQAIKSKPKHPKQKPLTSEIDKWNTIEARLAYIINKDALIYSLYGLKLTRQWNFVKRAHQPQAIGERPLYGRLLDGPDEAEFPAQQETVSILAQDNIRDINATSKVDQKCTLTATFGAVPFASRLVQPPIVCSDRCRLQKAMVLVTGGVWPSDIGYLDTTVLGSKFERGALVPYWSLV